MEQDIKKLQTWKDSAIINIGSAVGSFIADFLQYPIDSINTLVKIDNRNRGAFTIARKTVNTHGIKSQFRGINTQFAISFLPATIYFYSYESLNLRGKDYLKKNEMSSYIPFLPSVTATVSEAISLFLYMPLDQVRTRLQAGNKNHRYKSILHGLRKVIGQEGIIRLFLASPAYLINIILYNTIQFQTFEYMRIQKRKENYLQGLGKTVSTWDTLVITQVSTFVSTLATNPLDFIITKFQATDSTVEKDLSLRKIVKIAYNKHGLLGLNKGMGVKLLYNCQNASIVFTCFNYLRENYGVDFSD